MANPRKLLEQAAKRNLDSIKKQSVEIKIDSDNVSKEEPEHLVRLFTLPEKKTSKTIEPGLVPNEDQTSTRTSPKRRPVPGYDQSPAKTSPEPRLDPVKYSNNNVVGFEYNIKQTGVRGSFIKDSLILDRWLKNFKSIIGPKPTIKRTYMFFLTEAFLYHKRENTPRLHTGGLNWNPVLEKLGRPASRTALKTEVSKLEKAGLIKRHIFTSDRGRHDGFVIEFLFDKMSDDIFKEIKKSGFEDKPGLDPNKDQTPAKTRPHSSLDPDDDQSPAKTSPDPRPPVVPDEDHRQSPTKTRLYNDVKEVNKKLIRSNSLERDESRNRKVKTCAEKLVRGHAELKHGNDWQDKISEQTITDLEKEFEIVLDKYEPKGSLDFPVFWNEWPMMVNSYEKDGYKEPSFLQIRLKKGCKEWGGWLDRKKAQIVKKIEASFDILFDSAKKKYFRNLRNTDKKQYHSEAIEEYKIITNIDLIEKLKEK